MRYFELLFCNVYKFKPENFSTVMVEAKTFLKEVTRDKNGERGFNTRKGTNMNYK